MDASPAGGDRRFFRCRCPFRFSVDGDAETTSPLGAAFFFSLPPSAPKHFGEADRLR